jgi:lysozyme family protein
MSGSVSAQDEFLTALAFTIREEGGYSCDPDDPGGATNLGVTIGTLSAYERRACSAADVAALTVDVVTPLYHAWFWNSLRCWGLPRGAALMVFDHAVNAGAGASARVLQAVVAAGQSAVPNVAQDGIIGAITASAARAMQPTAKLIAALSAAQDADYRTKGDFSTFGNEWLGRLGRRTAEATRVAAL